MKKQNIFKSFLSLILLFIVVFGLVSCQKEKSLEDYYNEIFQDVNVSEVKENLKFPTSLDDVTISYESTAETVISNTGEVTRGLNDQKVYVIVTLTRGDESLQKTISLVVKAEGKKPATGETNATVSLAVQGGKITLSKGDTANLIVTTEGETNGEYTYSYSKENLVSVSDTDVVSFNADIKVDTTVVVTITLNDTPSATDSVTLYLKAPVVEGEYGDLTTAMLEKIGNTSVKVTGEVVDYYTDYNQTYNSSTNYYDYTVIMEDGKWYGTWNAKDSSTVIADTYVRGESVVASGSDSGHPLMRMYVDKNNTVQTSIVKNYLSVPTLWESQHLWNHLAQLSNFIHDFTYDEEAGAYHYTVDVNDDESLYLMTYLSYCLTPMLEDTLNYLWIYVDTNTKEITKILGQTEVLQYGGETDESGNVVNPDSASYTVVTFNFSEIGSAKVADLQTFEAPEYADILEKALKEMRESCNYTFQAVETETTSPTIDSDDYSYTESVKSKVTNATSSTGTVGLYGQVTREAVLLANTGKYEYAMDDNLYHTEYTGYKQVSENIFDYFENTIESETQADGTSKVTNSYLQGKKQYEGQLTSILPTFDFSANVFKLVSQNYANGHYTYTYTLRDSSIMRDIAMEVSMHSYAKSANASSSTSLTIVIDGDGHLISTTFPYSLVQGTWMGYITTTYSEVGTTTIPEGTFDNYVPRVLKQSWNEYTVKYYTSTGSTLDSHDESAEVVFAAIYGDDADLIPLPSLFFNMLGDNFYGPFYDDTVVGTDAEGNEITHGLVSITVKTDYADENQQMSEEQYQALMQEFKTKLEALGYVYNISASNTSSSSNRVVVFDIVDESGDDGITIKIENNGTRYLWIYFYQLGDYPKSK